MGIITNSEIQLECPECKYIQPVVLGDVVEEKQIICGGCKKAIKLKFSGDDPTKVEQELNKLFRNVSKTIKIKI